MKTYISSVVGAVALAVCFVASAQTFKTDEQIEAMGYSHIYSLDIPDYTNFKVNGVPYSVDNSNLNLGPIESVAYRLNLGDDNFCYASFGAYTSDLTRYGVPTYANQNVQQRYVHNLYYEAKSPLLNTAGTSVSQGNIEFWYLNYEQNNAAGIPNASGATDRSGYDFGDKATNGFHGSMQLHDYQNRTTIFAFNNWNNAGEDAALGVGKSNIANTGPDWTFAANSQSYNVKQMDIFAKPVFSQMSESDYAAISGEVSGMKLLYKLDCPLQGKYSTNNYVINNSVNSDLSGMPLKRVGYYMVLDKGDGTVDYAYAGYDATTNDLSKLGLPFDGSVRQQTVSNMTVQSNVAGVVNGKNIATGNIEMWNSNYNENNSANVPNASGSEFDFGDNPTNGDYGCFQIHNYGAGQTVMALNKWNGQASGNKSIDIGIGNNTGSGRPDYTFNGDDKNTSNASKYETRSLYVLAEPAIAPGMENVADASKYVLVQGAKLTTQMGTEWRADYQGVDYNIANNVAQLQKTLGPFDRVGYYMEYAQTVDSDLNYVFVSFDTMTADISKIGVPVYGTGEFYQQTVKNMQVTTNVPATEGLISAPGTTTQATPNTTYAHNTGYLEFWPSNYTNAKANVISQGDGNTYDINDSGSDMGFGYGSMQIHSLDTEQTIYALNNFKVGKGYGIGTNPNASTNRDGSQRDWTFDSSKTGYAIANIYTFAKPVLSDMDAEHFQPIQSEAANMHLVYKLDCPLYGTYSADNYTVNNLNNLGDLAGMPLKRVAYYMTLEKADGEVDYAYASYDATTNNPANIGMPFDGSIRQGTVNNLTVSSNVPGVINGTGLSGNIEIWRNTYEKTNSASIPGASDSAYDTGDKPTNGSYGSFQIHNYGNNQTVMALNAWNGVATSASRTIDIGIGNNNTGAGDPDYTFNGDQGANSNASQYTNRTLYVMAEAALAPGMANVTNGSEYTMVQGVRLTTQMGTNWHDNGVNYDIVNNLATLQGQGILFDRVGYYMEYAQTLNDPLTYVFASFDAMTNDIGRIGIPTSKSGEFYQQVVSNLEVTTNATTSQGLINDPTTGQQAAPNITISHNQGYIEFWASNYGQAKSGIISQGDDNTFDINDSGGSTGAGHGSMQVHSLATEQTIFALNHLNGAKQYGIGTNPNASTTSSGGQRDWTHDESKTGYAIANVYTFVHPVDALLTTNAMSMYQRDLANTADVKLAGTWAVSNGITIDTLQASVDGGDWINLTMNSDGTFTGTTSLIGGMHDVQYQALDSNGNVIATKSGQIGVGEIFITAGQSNSTNYGDAAQSSTSPLAYAYNPKTGQWQHNSDPQQGPLDNSTRGSTWPAFADKMAELEGVPIATYSVGYGGTSQSQWEADWNSIYSNFENAMDFLNENANGFAGVLWHQGESDRGTAEDVYYSKLNALIERSREDSGNEDLPWGVAIASADGNGVTYANVTNAQYRVIADDPLVFEGVNTDEYPRELRGEGGNSIHLSVAGLQRAGEDWALTAGEDIVGLRKYWLANSDEATAIPNWEVNGGYKLGIKLVDGDAQSVETDNAVQMANDGTIEVGEGYDLTLTGNVSGNGAMLKIGKGALTFSGDRSEYTGKTAVSNGTLTLSGAAVPSNGSVEAADDTTLVYNVDAGDSQQLTLSDDVTVIADNVRKTGGGQLKIKADGDQFTANNFAVEAGELDFKGDYNGNLEIKSGAKLSPGNSVGDLTVIGNVVIDAGATGLFEFSAYNPDPESQEYDTLTIADDDNKFELADGSMIELSFAGNPALWAEEGSRYQLVFDNGFADGEEFLDGVLVNYQDMFALLGTPQGLFLVGLGAPESTGVPEPSTWALLLLGTAGLFWLRRKNSLQKNRFISMNKTRFFALAILFLQLTVCQAQEKDCVVYRWTQMDGSVSLSFTEPVYQCDYYRIRITPAEVGTDIKYLDVCSPFAKASVGDDGFFVLSQGQLITFRDQPEGLYSPGVVPMPMLGLKTPKAGCCLVVVKGMPYDYRPRVQLKDGKYSLSLRFTFNGVKPYEDVIIDVYPLGRDGTYSDVARRYRQYQLDRGECRPLAERVKNNPELLYAIESVEVRLRLGWKPVPSPVPEQTPETEPEMKVAIDFDRVADILDEFKRQGIDKAEFCLVGWNIGGHDGRYPQIFPVDPRLGGEEKLKALIQKAQSMGYQITCHTNSTDGYSIADTWNEDLCLVNRDGSLNHPQTTWGGGRMYNLCPQPVYERYTQSDLPRIAQLGFRGVHYIDVISTVAPRECWDKNHPLNKRQCVEYWKKILAQGQKNFGAVGSEGAFDHVVSNLDYCLYATFNDIIDPSKMPLVERTVPMCQLVYNGILLQNPCTATVNPTIKGKTAELKLQEFNGRPVFYFYSKFKSDGKSWMGDSDLTCQTDEQLRESVKAVKRSYDEYRQRVNLQYLFMDKHEQLAPGVFRTTFSDGTVREFKYEE